MSYVLCRTGKVTVALIVNRECYVILCALCWTGNVTLAVNDGFRYCVE